jgi:cell division FtsZ-interacting protein ZapD
MTYDHGQPIEAWVACLPKEDRAAVVALVGVRTVGDLVTVLERSEVEKTLAAKLRKALQEGR